MSLLLPIVAALVALLILPGLSFSFDVTPKVVVAIAGAAVALTLSCEWPRQRTRSFQWFAILAALEAAAILLATLFSTHRALSWFGSAWRRSGLFAELAVLILAVLAAAHLAADRARLRLLLRITVLAALPAAIYGIVQYFGIDPWMLPSGYRFGEGPFTIVRPPSTLGHATYFATYLLYAVFAGIALALAETNRVWKTAALAASALAGFAIVLSGTRAALVGLIAGALFIAVRQRLRWGWLAAGVAMLILLAGFYTSPAGERLRARVHWSSEDPLGGARLLLWRDTLRMSRGRVIAGYGPETFTVEFPHYQSLELARAFPDFYHESPHNIFLDALISKGILGLLPLLGLAALGIAMARGPMGGAFVAILVSQQFSAFTLPTELYFYICLVILVSDFKPQRILATRPRPWQWTLAIPFAAFALYMATGDILLGSARRALDRGDPDEAARTIARARQWRTSADIYFSRRFQEVNPPDAALRLRSGQYALDAAVRATETADDRQNAWVNLSAFYAERNNAFGLEQSLREAIAAAPNWYKPHWLLAQVLALEGRAVEAEAESRAAFERNNGKNPEVTRVMEQLRR